MSRLQFCSSSWLLALLILVLSPSQDVMGQIDDGEQVQMQFHRAQMAWRNQTSILEAKVRVDQVLRDAPNHAEAWKLRAEVHIAMERYAEALYDARQATLLDPSDGEAFLIMAEAARLTQDNENARRSLEKAATLSIDASADFHIKLSRSAVMLGDNSEYDMAESFARVALAKDPDFAEAYYQLARVFVLQERDDAAATTLKRGFEAEMLDPVYVGLDSTLGVLQDHESLQTYFNN